MERRHFVRRFASWIAMTPRAEISRGATIVLIVLLGVCLHMDPAAAQSVALVMEEATLRQTCEAAAHADGLPAHQAGRSTTLHRCGNARATLEHPSVLGVLMCLALVAPLGKSYAALRASRRRL